jgi:hypothetical protein
MATDLRVVLFHNIDPNKFEFEKVGESSIRGFDEDKFLVLRLDTLLARVAMELDCVDSVSGERAAALVHTLKNRKYFEKGTPARLLNVRDAFGIWAQSLRKRFDAAKARADGGFEEFESEDRKLRFEEGK